MLTLKVYGPYTRLDGRKHVCIVTAEGKRITQSYPRYLMEKYLGRKLLNTETVDHIDNDFTNDVITNLQLLTLAQNIQKSAKVALTSFHVCPNCNKKFEALNRQTNNNQIKKRGKGPFCSRSCAGKFTYVNHWSKRQPVRVR